MNTMPEDAGVAAMVEEEEETPLHGAIWLIQALGIAMPPIPDVYIESLEEVLLERLFATDRSLTALHSPQALAEAIAQAGWPKSGLAFGCLSRGSRLLWFYTLVGEQQIIHISLRFEALDAAARGLSKGFVSHAHSMLEAYLRTDANYYRAIGFAPPADDQPRSIIVYGDEAGAPIERHAFYRLDAGLTPWIECSEIFSEAEDQASRSDELVTLRA